MPTGQPALVVRSLGDVAEDFADDMPVGAGSFFSGRDFFFSEKTWRVTCGGWRVIEGG